MSLETTVGLCLKAKLLIILLAVVATSANHHQLSHTIRPNTDEETQQKSASDVLRRLIGEKADDVAIKINFNLPGNYFKLRKTNNSQVLRIEASNGVSACKAFQYYLKNYCGAHLSWDGNRLPLLDEFPIANIEMRASSEIIYYQNVCTHSYSFSWWTWTDWRKHIDWIAFSGITLTLAPFQEDIWTDVFTDYGMNQTEIDEHLAGPGFFAWQRMGNLRGWGGKLSANFIKVSSELQRRMIKALNELGISVALPAFDGHLPIHFRQLFPDANFSVVESWNNFPPSYCCPLFVDPTEPLFQEIGRKFLQRVTQKYGTNHVYFSDPFNEVQPRFQNEKYLRDVSASIYSAMESVDPKAIWLLQGWMFVKNPVWSEGLIEAFLTAVPQGNILVLDLQSEQHPQYNRTKSFYGQPFVWCMLHNFGGTLGMHGSIRLVNVELPRAAGMLNSTMLGVGITPEGINQNFVVYEFALDKAWQHKEVNTRKWVKKYAGNRYGFSSKMIEDAWCLLLRSVYAYEGDESIHGKYTLCRRPSLKLQPWKWYNETDVTNALGKFVTIAANETLVFNELFERDLVDLTRQFLQNRADSLYLSIVDVYKKKNLIQFALLTQQFLDLLNDLDSLLATHNDFLLGNFLEAAKARAFDDVERKQLEFNARNQITLWGPNGQINDYATKQWSGIVKDYFRPRWSLFFEELKASLDRKSRFNQNKFQEDVFNQVEYPFNVNSQIYPTQPAGSPALKAKLLYEKWVNMKSRSLRAKILPIKMLMRHGEELFQ